MIGKTKRKGEPVMEQLVGKMRAAMQRYRMVEEGAKIAVAVSGGKDSLALLWGMAKLSRYKSSGFSIVAITADPCFGGVQTDYAAVEAVCREWGVPYTVRRTALGTVIFEQRKEQNPCSLCARMRRGILHNMALEAGCNAIALGHHWDDAVETFFLNLIYGGKIGCFAPKSYLSRKKLWMLRPMVFCREEEIAALARRENLPVVKSRCPADGDTARQSMKELVRTLERDYPGLRTRVLGAMQRAGIDGWGEARPE